MLLELMLKRLNKMSEMVPINLRLPKDLESKVRKLSSRNSTSPAEYIRSSVIKSLIKFGILPNISLVNALNKISRTKIVSEEKEIKALKDLRERLWKEKYGSSS